MPTFYLKYTINESARADCLTLFGGMTKEDDAADTGDDVQIKGRWSTVGESRGFCICEAKTTKALNAWLLNWSTMATIEATPVVDDNQAREILLGAKPPFQVNHFTNGTEAKAGESLYFIEYRFHPGKREEGFRAFASMTREQDAADAGNNTCLGRWHNLGAGSGVAICSSPSAMDLHAWAHHWTSLCDCAIRPVVSDEDARENIRAKPDFAAKHAALVERMKPTKKSWWRA